jgi:hypothetical protein
MEIISLLMKCSLLSIPNEFMIEECHFRVHPAVLTPLSDRGFLILFARSIPSYDVLMLGDDLPATDIYFSVFGSTYRRRAMPGSSGDDCNRNRICVTVPALQHFHEVRLRYAIERGATWMLADFQTHRPSCCEVSG